MTTTKFKRLKGTLGRVALVLALAGGAAQAMAAATIVIQNNDGPGEGFNDPTPAAPVGGNSGTTLGQQRLIAFQYAANIWGATLSSSVPILIDANFDPLTCSDTSAVLGSAGATEIFRDFAGAPKAGTWYPAALANKITGVDQAEGRPQIAATFNANLGQPGCLPGSPFYLGLDNNHGPLIDLVAVLLHEFGHGLGFQTFTNGSNGLQQSGRPSIWDHFLFDPVQNKNWTQLTNLQRRASAISGKLAWSGPIVTAAVPEVLRQGTPRLVISGPAAGPAAGQYLVGEASFGPPLQTVPLLGQLMPVVDQADGTGLACTALSAANALAVKGNVALVDRGSCTFAEKAKIVQNAGAIAMIVADNAAGSPPPGLGGSDPTVTIPSVRITQADGVTLKARLVKRSRTKSGVIADLAIAGSQYAGADALGRMLMFTPNPFQGGSSVSHWDVSAFPNLLMEPSINGDLTQSVIPPQDLTFRLLQEIGW